VVLWGLLVLATSGALLARAGTPVVRVVAGVVMLAPFVALFGVALWQRRHRDRVLEPALRATAAVDGAQAARLGRAARLVIRLSAAPTGESLDLSKAHLDDVLAGASGLDIEGVARRRARRMRWFALGLLLVGLVLCLGRGLAIVEGLYVLAARRGVAPFEISYIEQSEIEAELPAHVGGTVRRVPVVYDQVMLPSGSEVIWRMIPRVTGRKYVVTDGYRDVPFVSDGHGAWVARMVVDDSCDLRAAAVFGDVKVLHDESVRISTIADRPPTVTLLGGPREVRIADLDRLPIEFIAQDDYGLSLVELVIESGDRKERQELARLDGTRRIYRAATAITRKTPLVQGAYQPVRVTVQARDGDLSLGPTWGKSEAIILLPEPIGEHLAERHLALRGFRRALVDFRMAVSRASSLSSAAQKEAHSLAQRGLEAAYSKLERTLGQSPEPPRGSLRFLQAQVTSLGAPAQAETRIEKVLLATDVLLTQLSRADAERLARDLGDVVAEVAASVHAAQNGETGPKREQLLSSLETARQGALRLAEVGAAGLDLGSVAGGDLARAKRLLEAAEYSRAEAALLHLAARLRRATPSFGSKGAGVESGSSGGGTGSEPPLSRAPSEYDRLSEQARSLAEQHAREQSELEQLLQDAAQAAEADARKDEDLKRASDELRAALEDLPNFGRTPGSALSEAAQARSQGEAMADALDAGQLERALEAGRAAAEGLERARRANEAQGGYLPSEDLERARAAVDSARKAAEQAARKSPRPALAERAQRQRELGRAAMELSERAGEGAAPLPGDVREALRRAGDLMQKAAEALDRNEAERGRELSADAQEELERALPERPENDSEAAAEGDTEADGDQMRSDGHAEVPGRGEDRSRDFRRRVEAGLGREAGRFGPAVRRYAETLK